MHADQAIVQKDLVPFMQVAGKLFVGHLRNVAVAQHFAGGQNEFLAILQHGTAPIKLYQANLRAFGVQQGGNRAVQFCSQALQHLQAAGMLRIISVRKIKTRHVHTTEDHIPQDIFPVRRRAERADNFGFPHRFLLFSGARQKVSRRAYERASFALSESHRPHGGCVKPPAAGKFHIYYTHFPPPDKYKILRRTVKNQSSSFRAFCPSADCTETF